LYGILWPDSDWLAQTASELYISGVLVDSSTCRYI
jgi:hypothetical protein